MSKITSADCVKAIVSLCSSDESQVIAVWTGDPSLVGAHLSDPARYKKALDDIRVDFDENDYPTSHEVADMFYRLSTASRNWKRISKEKENGAILRIFCNNSLMDLCAYVYEDIATGTVSSVELTMD